MAFEKAIAKEVFLRRGVAAKDPQQRPTKVAPDRCSEKGCTGIFGEFKGKHALLGISKRCLLFPRCPIH